MGSDNLSLRRYAAAAALMVLSLAIKATEPHAFGVPLAVDPSTLIAEMTLAEG